MAKTMLAISLLVGAGGCASSPTATRSTPAPTPTLDEPVTDVHPTRRTTTTPPPTTTSVPPEPVEEAPVATAAPRARSAPTTAYQGPVEATDGDAPLACIRRYEQGAAGYATDTGNGFYGAYQFDLGTWASVGGSGNPAHASPAEQDRRAEMLYDRRGLQPWPTPAVMCG